MKPVMIDADRAAEIAEDFKRWDEEDAEWSRMAAEDRALSVAKRKAEIALLQAQAVKQPAAAPEAPGAQPTPPKGNPSPDYFTSIKDAAAHVGKTPKTVSAWIRRDWLPVEQNGRKIRIARVELEKIAKPADKTRQNKYSGKSSA